MDCPEPRRWNPRPRSQRRSNHAPRPRLQAWQSPGYPGGPARLRAEYVGAGRCPTLRCKRNPQSGMLNTRHAAGYGHTGRAVSDQRNLPARPGQEKSERENTAMPKMSDNGQSRKTTRRSIQVSRTSSTSLEIGSLPSCKPVEISRSSFWARPNRPEWLAGLLAAGECFVALDAIGSASD